MAAKTDPFESAFFLIEWAKGGVRDLASEIRIYMASKPHQLSAEFDPEKRVKELKLRLTKPIPNSIRGMASDVIKNVRDALDQATAAASYVVTGKRSRRTHFPFGNSADDLENSLSRRKVSQCKDIPEQLFPKLRAFMPYMSDWDTALKCLSLISGNHKHGSTLTLSAQTNQISLGTNVFNAGGGLYIPPRCVPDYDEIIIAWVPEGASATLNLNFPIFIAFDHQLLRYQPAIQFLHYCAERVGCIVTGLREEASRIAA